MTTYCPTCEEDVEPEWEEVPGPGDLDNMVACCPICGDELEEAYECC